MLSSTATSDHIAVSDTSAQSTALAAGTLYKVVCSVDSYIKLGAADPTASAADGNHLVPAGVPFYFINAVADHKVALLRVGANSGVATISVAQSAS